MSEPPRALDPDGPAAPPRSNGELLFEAPWESRVFGLTLTLCERGAFEWDEFRELLIDEIARWERSAGPDHVYRYYERWQAALERLLERKDLVLRGDLDDRARAYEARPAGHDHAHDHTHPHRHD